ncbi:MAG TPA: hypothetical protein QGG30_01490 [Acidobacteriota bacterium]|jgi:hypothetical protein|nr:hypothetical protein [Acidobacteriota bacterium]HJO29143.1 hypothetical protein [Acidobacteriota bacterium]|tara:strand:- start:719 stop:877 length:159 start_codon:yes stop_codon:yes gene_type:complete
MTNEEDHAAIHEKLDELQAMLWRVKVLANWILGISIGGWLLWLLDGWIKAMD